MEIGKKRPLACFCWIITVLMGVFAIAIPRLTVTFLQWLVIVGGIFAVSVAVSACLFRKRAGVLLYLAFLISAFVLGSGVFLMHKVQTYRPAATYAEKSGGEETLVTGLILSRDYDSSYQTTFTVEIRIPESRRGVCGQLTTSYVSELQAGDRFSCLATVRYLPDANTDGSYSGMYADGVLLLLTCDDENCETVTERGIVTPEIFWRNLRTHLSTRLSQSVDGEPGRLISALLLGNADGLRRETVLNFRRAGVSHLLALSGLHLTLIMALFSWLLHRLRAPFWLRKLLLPMLALAYLMQTGCSVSTQRAVAMLLYLQLADLLGVPGDSLTSLSVFVAGSVLYRPTAVLDVGMWLSVVAAFVLVEFVPALSSGERSKQERNTRDRSGKAKGARLKSALRHRFKRLIGALAASCAVAFFLTFPSAVCFGEMSLLSPVSTLLLTPLLEGCLILGLCLLPLLFCVNFPVLGTIAQLLSGVLYRLAEGMLSTVQYLSDRRHIMLSLRYPFVGWMLAIGGCATLIFLLFRWKKPRRFLAVMTGIVLVFALLLGMTVGVRSGRADVVYVRHGKSELLCLHDAKSTVLCDLSDGSYTTYRDFFDSALPDDTTEIESVVLTHYHNRHIATLRKLFNRIRVRSIWLPLTTALSGESKADQDTEIMRAIAVLAEEYRVSVHTYLPEQGVTVTDNIILERLVYQMIPRSTHPTLAVCFRYEDQRNGALSRLTFLGASVWESDAWSTLKDNLPDNRVLIVGMHGPILKTEPSFPENLNVAEVLIADEGTFNVTSSAICQRIPEETSCRISDGITCLIWTDAATASSP